MRDRERLVDILRSSHRQSLTSTTDQCDQQECNSNHDNDGCLGCIEFNSRMKMQVIVIKMRDVLTFLSAHTDL